MENALQARKERLTLTGRQNRSEVIGYPEYINNLFMADQIFGYIIVDMFCSIALCVTAINNIVCGGF